MPEASLLEPPGRYGIALQHCFDRLSPDKKAALLIRPAECWQLGRQEIMVGVSACAEARQRYEAVGKHRQGSEPGLINSGCNQDDTAPSGAR